MKAKSKGTSIMKMHFYLLGIFFVTLTSNADDFALNWSQQQINSVDSYSSNQKIVGTHYFYWYDYPGEHFYDNGAKTDDALQDHFVNPEMVSYRSVAWHKQELDDIAAAGIDFILPVYWGAPDHYDRAGISFSVEGLPPLQKAVEEREREGKTSPKIGLFYDTSTLLPGMRDEAGRERYDLTADDGKDIFYRTIRDFFYQIDPKNWACIDGRPIVVLYGSGFAKSHGQSTVDYVYEQFAKDFYGVKPYIIKDNSWNFACDATTQWGAALNGPNIFGKVAQVGAGYNDSAVPGRSTPIREREDGNFYRQGWNKILNEDINVVIIETWNEMHEGTGICATKEYGRTYIDLTATYVKAFKAGETLNESITLQFPKLQPRPANDRGMEFKDAKEVSVALGDGGKNSGIWLVRGQPDGPVNNANYAAKPCVQSAQGDNTYMYFDIADPFFFDQKHKVEITLLIWDEFFHHASLQYDSHDGSATLDGAYKTAAGFACENTHKWVEKTFVIEDARFINRENGGADFRISVNGQLAVAEITVKKIVN
jgi:hypothetical protein